MNAKERLELSTRLIEETRKIGESVKDIMQPGDHMSLTWWPDGHTDVAIYGERAADATINAFSCRDGGRVILL